MLDLRLSREFDVLLKFINAADALVLECILRREICIQVRHPTVILFEKFLFVVLSNKKYHCYDYQADTAISEKFV